MKNKSITILFADDLEIDRVTLRDSLERLAPEIKMYEWGQGATLLPHLLSLNTLPRLLILDRSFAKDQAIKDKYCYEGITLALDIRNNHSRFDSMAILIYSAFSNTEDSAKFSDKHKLKGIWCRPKDGNHEVLVTHIREILSQWPPVAS
jgi:hypothetical protein